ncbi:membrane dipeptidase [Marinitoga hydrogenitolerans DSM 16785]|uniref:Membrane dipeptidase n=1 Tax=Marinitoga hydrogenitolerans (strain DSM 16785 / JCM 12826 / AT1271) TaxID=1122195 RepID=A0A1M4TPP2_MARH1|nr:dipeptidase [Marinitoga hydrogenitolerans]SHE46365.1 membrane dipeptidase [Marinitoga hydrogenitolerans DSM 16785]
MNILKSIVIDGHFDLLIDVYEKRKKGRKSVILTDHYEKFKKGGFNIIVSSLFIPDIYIPEMALRNALDQISSLYLEIEESNGKIMLCKNLKDIKYAVDNNILGIMLSFEGLEPIGNDIYLLRVFYELGVRFAGLVWSRRNYVADGCFFNERLEGEKGGLTDFGVKVLKELEKLGMIVDVSHLNDEGFWDVIKFTEKPVIASHSNVRNIYHSMRNLTDDQIKAIAEINGVIGINGNGYFVTDKDEENNAEGLVKHVDYISNLVGVEYVGIGFDFCDMFSDFHRDSLNGHHELVLFIEALEKHGYNENEIKLILGENFLRVYKSVFDD